MKKLIIMLFVAGGCTYSPAFGDLSCDDESATRPGQRCEGGVWVLADTGPADIGGTPDVGGGVDLGGEQDSGRDVGAPDMSMPPDMQVDMNCSAESDGMFCARLAKTCGAVTDTDNCGDARTAECGTCADLIETCTDNVCAPVPETDQELCDAVAATCDNIMATDRTGAARTAFCGTCVPPLGCGDGGTPNTCACANANDVQFCADNGANCGAVTAMDPLCNTMRTVNCGTCTAPETCGGGNVLNVCGCMETDAAFCARLSNNCGSVTANDACGDPRTVNCGTCTGPETCEGGGVQNVCGCTVADACTALNAECGTVNTSASCDNLLTADCGGCGAQGACQANLCVCNPGYSYNGSSCADVDECTLNTDTCDVNATCTNTPGGFTCACNPPFVGNGMTCMPPTSPPTIEQIVNDTASLSTLTTGTMTAVDDDLYVAFVVIRTASRTVDSISGLGLTWTRAGQHCNDDNSQTLEVWTARGNTSGDSNIVVSLSGIPFAAATSVYRISNVPSSGSPGTATMVNSGGVDGSCQNSNASSSYSFPYTVMGTNPLLLVGTAIEESAHTPGTGWTEDDEQHRDGGGDNDAGLATMHPTNAGNANVTVSGTLSQSQSWASAVFEVRGL